MESKQHNEGKLPANEVSPRPMSPATHPFPFTDTNSSLYRNAAASALSLTAFHRGHQARRMPPYAAASAERGQPGSGERRAGAAWLRRAPGAPSPGRPRSGGARQRGGQGARVRRPRGPSRPLPPRPIRRRRRRRRDERPPVRPARLPAPQPRPTALSGTRQPALTM